MRGKHSTRKGSLAGSIILAAITCLVMVAFTGVSAQALTGTAANGVWGGGLGLLSGIGTGGLPNPVFSPMGANEVKYSITYKLNGGKWIHKDGWKQYYVAGEYATIPSTAPTKEGYDFNGWLSSGSEGHTYWPNSKTNATKHGRNRNFTAQWKERTYRVSYDANGGNGSMSSTSFSFGKRFDAGSCLSENAFTRGGYVFKGWSLESGADNAVAYATGTYGYKYLDAFKSGASLTLYAVWEANEYSVDYDLAGGSWSLGGDYRQTYRTGDGVYLASETPTKDGHAFAGWMGSDGLAYASGAWCSSYGSIKLTAQWEEHAYTVCYDANGGRGSMSSMTFRHGERFSSEFRLAECSFTKEGSVFKGWSLSPGSGNSVDYSPGTYPYRLLDSLNPGSSLTLYAVWEVPTWSVSYDLAGGSWPTGVRVVQSYQGSSPRFSLPTPMRSPSGGYSFLGWTGTGLSAAQRSVTVIPARGDTGDRHYVANWQPVEFPIEYDLGDDHGRKAELPAAGKTSYTCEMPAFYLPHPARLGYEFVGWSGEGISEPRKDVLIPQGSTGTRSYHAHWERAGAAVSFDANGGTGEMDSQWVPGATCAELRTCAFENGGLSFTGWNTRADGSGTAYADHQLVRADTLEASRLYAQWTDLPLFQNVYEPKGGVAAKKVDSAGRPLAGATFSVVKSGADTIEDALEWSSVAASGSGGTAIDISADVERLDDVWVRDIVSDSSGVASTAGDELEAGWYAVFETAAPQGYEIGPNPPCWAVLVSEQGRIETRGSRNSQDDPDDMTAVNLSTSEKRSGVAVAKTDLEQHPLAGATFEARLKADVDAALVAYEQHRDEVDEDEALLYTSASDYVDQTVEPDAVFCSEDQGVARSNARAFALSAEVCVVETNAPEGYDRPGHDYETGENVAYVTSGAQDGTFGSTASGVTFADAPQKGTVEIEAEKRLVGGSLSGGAYSFVLEDAPGNPRRTVPEGSLVAVNGISEADAGSAGKPKEDPARVRFAPIEFTSADIGKVFRYRVREEVSNMGEEVAYDARTAVYEVRVRGGRAGELDVKAELVEGPTAPEDEEGKLAVFSNEVKHGKAELKVKKRLLGAALKPRQFSFEAYSDAACTQKIGKAARNDGLGNVIIGPLDFGFHDIGQHEVFVRELSGNMSGVTYDAHVYKAVVTVSDSGDAELKTKVTWSDAATGAKVAGSPVFSNVYGASGSVTLRARKTLAGASLSEGMFAFEAIESTQDGKRVVATGTNDASGDIAFTPISYSMDDIGEHVYQIRETEPVAGYAGDAHAETVKVVVEDNGDGTLGARARYEADGCSFANRAKTGKAVLYAKKTLVDERGNGIATKKLAAGEFEFEVFEDEACTQSTGLSGRNDAEGHVKLGSLKCQACDVGSTKSYWIRETPAKRPGIVYDGRVVRADVQVSDSGGHDLVCKVSYAGGAKAADAQCARFENVYAPQGELHLSATKRMSQGQMVSGEFRFEAIEHVSGSDRVVARGSNASAGTESEVAFEPIRYGLSDVGIHVYRLREVDGGRRGVEYDGHEEKVTVKVADDGSGVLATSVSREQDGTVFVNRATELAMPASGGSGAWVLLMATGLAMACLGAVRLCRGRKEER